MREAILPSPGMRHAHYRPTAAVHVVETPEEPLGSSRSNIPLCRMAYAGLKPHPRIAQLALHVVFDSIDDYARGFYEFLRGADRAGVQLIVMQQVPEVGIGQALRDRQSRAAGQVD